MENGDMQPLGANDGQAGVGIPQHQHCIGVYFYHQLVGLGNNIAHGFAQVLAYCIQIHIRIGKFQVFEENAVQIIIVVLAGVGQQAVKILPALVDDRRQTDDFRASAYNDQKLQFSVVFEGCHT